MAQVAAAAAAEASLVVFGESRVTPTPTPALRPLPGPRGVGTVDCSRLGSEKGVGIARGRDFLDKYIVPTAVWPGLGRHLSVLPDLRTVSRGVVCPMRGERPGM